MVVADVSLTPRFEGPNRAKALGAYYTAPEIAEFLVRWAVRSKEDRVLDPSFGGGVFLASACQRLVGLGAQQLNNVFGIEIDPGTHAQISVDLIEGFEIDSNNLLLSDFFSVATKSLPPFDAVVGNPPFIRYQNFNGKMRLRALARCTEEGVVLSRLSSSWAPFLIHSISMIKEGGRLAMVVPMEVTHAAYALPILEHLRASFETITFLTFKAKLFPNLNEETLLVLAEEKGEFSGEFRTISLPGISALKEFSCEDQVVLSDTRKIDAKSIVEGKQRLKEYSIPSKAQDLYGQIRSLSSVTTIGALTNVGIGYVTGANDFFHLTPEMISEWKIPRSFLRRAVRKGRLLSGLRLTEEDWTAAEVRGEVSHLLAIDSDRGLPRSIKSYIRYGEEQKISEAYKCRTRSPWYRVPHIYQPDAFLTYMSGATPRLVANETDAVSPNNLHVLRIHAGIFIKAIELAAVWLTSLTCLSVELEGHALGGGMLKLEPTEAGRVLVACPISSSIDLEGLASELDLLLRKGQIDTAKTLADSVILRDWIGLERADCVLLSKAADELRAHRCMRSAN